MEKDFWITQVQQKIKTNQSLLNIINKYDIKIYLFGSAIYKIAPRDLDILIIYNLDILLLKDITELKNQLVRLLQYCLHKKIDITLLSAYEEKEINFIRCENAVEIKLLLM